DCGGAHKRVHLRSSDPVAFHRHRIISAPPLPHGHCVGAPPESRQGRRAGTKSRRTASREFRGWRPSSPQKNQKRNRARARRQREANRPLAGFPLLDDGRVGQPLTVDKRAVRQLALAIWGTSRGPCLLVPAKLLLSLLSAPHPYECLAGAEQEIVRRRQT